MIVAGSNFGDPATPDQIERLRSSLPALTPLDYLDFFRRADGAQVWFDDADRSDFDCLRIYSLATLDSIRASLADLFPTLLVVGGDQGSQKLGYDMTATAPWPLVMHLPGYGSSPVAASFTELVQRYLLPPGSSVP